MCTGRVALAPTLVPAAQESLIWTSFSWPGATVTVAGFLGTSASEKPPLPGDSVSRYLRAVVPLFFSRS